MKVVMANKFWFQKGGAEKYMFDLIALLVRHGHAAVPFAMRHPMNLESNYERFFVSEIETREISSPWQALRTFGRMTWSFEAARKFRALVRETRSDILHAHNVYHQISPSIFDAARRLGLPAVMTLHDYHLISPNYGMFLNGRPAPPSPKHPYLWTVGHRAVEGSLSRSAAAAFKSWLHEKLRAWRHVHRFIAPSAFLRDMLVRYGWPEERVEVVPHFIDLAGREPAYTSADRVAYVGRLSPEKGVLTLLEAMRELPAKKCSIIGDGPDRARLTLVARNLGLKNVEFKGALHGDALSAELRKARAVVVPSLSFEVFGLSVLDAYALGKPVIASRIGGIPEIVRDGETGLLFRAGDRNDLAVKLASLDEDKAARMGRAGRALAETDYAPELHYERIMKVYRETMGS